MTDPDPGVIPFPLGGEPAPRRLDPGDLVAAAYEAHQREIHSFVLHATRDPDTAADVTQEAFLRLLREVSERTPPDNVRAWLYRVASNLVVTGARRTSVVDRWRRRLGVADVAPDSPEGAVLATERDERVRSALARLPNDTRVALLLAANGFSGREVAAAIGRSELATRSLLCRARTQLRQVFSTLEEAT